MIWQFDIVLLTLVLICAVMALVIKDLMGAVIVFGAYSFLMCLVWTSNGAVDVAFTEAAVGAGVGTVFFISTVYNTTRLTKKTKSRGNRIKLIASIIVGLACSGSNTPPMPTPPDK